MELNKTCFQHDIAYRNFKDIPRRTASDKVLHDKTFKTASNPKYDRYQCGLASVVYKFYDSKSRDTATHIGTGIFSEDQQFANELYKLINRKYQRCIEIPFGVLILQT